MRVVVILVVVLASSCAPGEDRVPPDGGPAIGGNGPPVIGQPVVPDGGVVDERDGGVDGGPG